MYVVNYEDQLIIQNPMIPSYYDNHCNSYQEAKKDLIDYWEGKVEDAKNTLEYVKNIKEVKKK